MPLLCLNTEENPNRLLYERKAEDNLGFEF